MINCCPHDTALGVCGTRRSMDYAHHVIGAVFGTFLLFSQGTVCKSSCPAPNLYIYAQTNEIRCVRSKLGRRQQVKSVVTIAWHLRYWQTLFLCVQVSSRVFSYFSLLFFFSFCYPCFIYFFSPSRFFLIILFSFSVLFALPNG